MPSTVEKTITLNLANAGDYIDVDVRGVPGWGAHAIGNEHWHGSVNVGVLKVIGNQASEYSSAKVLTKTVGTAEDIEDEHTQAVRFVVLNADPLGGRGRIAVFGKETK